MLINLVPDFLTVVASANPVAAYHQYFHAHERVLRAYWHNYVVDPDTPHFHDVVRATVAARRDDLHATLEHTDVVALARDVDARCRDLLAVDVDFDIVLMVGVGAANAGELVVGGRGMVFVCLEHFTGVANPATHSLGLDPELIPLWLAHEIAHVVRYTSASSRSEMKTLVDDAGGFYSYWDTASHAPLRELLVNEGLAVQAARIVSPGHAIWEYFGYTRREFVRVRELETAVARAAIPQLSQAGLGLRLRFLSGGMSERARTVNRVVLPPRAGYYLGARTVEPVIVRHGLSWAVRASAEELMPPIAEAQTA